MKRRLLFGVLGLATLAAACGGSGDKTVAAQGSVGGSQGSTTVTTAAPATITTAKPAVSADALQAALLTVEDLPSGYAVSPPEGDDDGDDTDDGYCDGSDPAQTVPPLLEKEVGFQTGTFGPFLGEGLMLFASTGLAKRYMAEARRIFDRCSPTCRPMTRGHGPR